MPAETYAVEETVNRPGESATNGESRYPEIDWSALVAQVQAGDEAGLTALYGIFSRGTRYYLRRQLGNQDIEDKVHDIFLIVVNAIRRGDLREPERLMGFVRTVAHRQVAAQIEKSVNARRDQVDLDAGVVLPAQARTPEQDAIVKQRSELMKSALEELSKRDREILVRFYLKEQTPEQICREMCLTDTQFRLTKSRAKAKFGAIGKKKLGDRFRLISTCIKTNAATA